MLTDVRIVDLTQPAGPATPPWPGGRPLEAEVGESFETGGSAYHRRLSLDEHLGTHIDAPAHFARDGIRVVALSPGPVETDRIVTLMKKKAKDRTGDENNWEELRKPLPFQRCASPAEIGAAIAFIVTDPGSETTVITPSRTTTPTVSATDGGAVVGGMWSF